MKLARKLWRLLCGAGIIFSPRPTNNYSQFLTDTVQYHH